MREEIHQCECRMSEAGHAWSVFRSCTTWGLKGPNSKNVLLFLTGKNKPTMNDAEQKQNHVVRFQNKYCAGVIFQRTLPGENCLFLIRSYN